MEAKSVLIFSYPIYLSKNCTPLILAIPIYKKTPKSTDIGINLRSGAIVTDKPINKETIKPDIRCSLTSVMCGLSPGA